MFTPAGSSKWVNESIVLSVGEIISINLLWTLIWKWSLAFLSINGEVFIAYTLLCEGSGIGPTTLAPVLIAVSKICWQVESITLAS